MTSITALLRPLIAIAALVLSCPPAGAQGASPAEVKTLSDAILRKPAWINESSVCPAQVMQPRPARATPIDEACYDTPSAACLARCEQGSADACYWLGQGLERAHALDLASQSLYQRACKLGNPSACTNRAAFTLPEDNKKDPQATDCALRTFEKTCAQDDPWGCTMLGMHLVRGIGIAPDPQRALQVLSRSCRLGDDDPACTAAKDLRAQAQEMIKGKPQKK